MSDLPPANWHIDPDDPDQYRYWDGQAWTDHRAPVNKAEEDSPEEDSHPTRRGLRGLWKTVSSAFTIAFQRRPRDFASVALIGWIGTGMGTVILYLTTRAFVADLSEIANTISQPGFDLESPEGEAYLESSLESLLESVTGLSVLLTLFAVMLILTTMIWQGIAVVRLALAELTGRNVKVFEAFRWAGKRSPRVFGVALQLPLLFVGLLIVIMLPVLLVMALLLFVAPWLLGPLFALAALAIIILPFAAVPMGLVTAATGPSVASLPYGFRLARNAYWPATGRMLLIVLVVQAVLTVCALVVSITFSPVAPLAENSEWLIFVVIQPIEITLQAIGATVLYHDLGGEMAET